MVGLRGGTDYKSWQVFVFKIYDLHMVPNNS